MNKKVVIFYNALYSFFTYHFFSSYQFFKTPCRNPFKFKSYKLAMSEKVLNPPLDTAFISRTTRTFSFITELGGFHSPHINAQSFSEMLI